MEEIMSDFISAIKRFIEDWERNHPAALVHYEPADDVVDQQVDEPHIEIKQGDIDVRQNETNEYQNRPVVLSQLPEVEVPKEIHIPKALLGQPPYGEGEGPGQWVMGLGNWQWLPDKPTEPPKGETFKTGQWVRNRATEDWSWISIRPTTVGKDGRSTAEPIPSLPIRTRPIPQPCKSDEQLLAEAKQFIEEVEQLMKELE
jgi:hypothetical protein